MSLQMMEAESIRRVNLSEDIEMTVINTNVGALHARHYAAKADLFVNKALERYHQENVLTALQMMPQDSLLRAK